MGYGTQIFSPGLTLAAGDTATLHETPLDVTGQIARNVRIVSDTQCHFRFGDDNTVVANQKDSLITTEPCYFKTNRAKYFSIVKAGDASASGTLTFSANPANNDTITLDGTVWTFVTATPSGNQTQITADVAATGDIDFATSGNPANNDTITVNGTVWTFVSAAPVGNQTQIAGSLSATMTQLASDLNGSADVNIDDATYTGTATTLDIVHDTPGTGGNSFTLAASAANPGVSGATLTGGVDNRNTTLDDLVTNLNASTVTAISAATYTHSAGVVTVTHDTPGTGGNAFTIAASVATASGATLASGTNVTGGKLNIVPTENC